MGYTQIMHEIEMNAKNLNIPVTGTFELSSKCNLNCEFCYAKQRNSCNKDLTTSEWKKIITDCVESGLLRATFTGGEPLTRLDFLEIYAHAYDLGVRITILSNGMLFNRQICDFLSKRKPEGISITMYGINDQEYEKICGVKYGFKHFDETINLLKEYNLPVSLKALAIPDLQDSLLAMSAYAKSKNIKISLTKYVSPYPLADTNFRLSADEIKYYSQFFDNANDVMGGIKSKSSECNISQCSAGKSRFAITPYGELMGCLCYPEIKVQIDDNFKISLEKLRLSLTKSGSNCIECKTYPYNLSCNKCPGLNYMETGDASKCGEYRKCLAAAKIL